MNNVSSLQRTLTTLGHQESDRVPIFPVLLMQGAIHLKMKLRDYFTRGDALAEGQLALLERYGHDCLIGVPHVVQDAAAFGAGLIYFEEGPPSLDRMVLRSFDDLSRLMLPDPEESAALRPTLVALEQLARAKKSQVPILGACIAPFSLPSMLIGAEAWMWLLFQPPPLRNPILRRFLELSTQFAVRWANVQLAHGADVIVLADGMACASVILRHQFIEHALPSITTAIAAIRGPVVYEGVGALEPFIDLLPDTGAAAVILDCTDNLAACKRAVGDKITLMGNLNNIAMVGWNREDIEAKVKAALSAAASGGGFILSAQGPEIPWYVPDWNIEAFIDAGKRLGSYPIQT